MKFGIDFGTTRVVVAAVDRGNYPVLSFEGPDGEAHDWFPPLLAVRGEERLFGWEAWAKQAEAGWTVVRSLKRSLEEAGPGTHLTVGEQTLPLMETLREMVQALRRDIEERSALELAPGELLEVMLGVPANANSNQRFLTVEAFRGAGFSVLGLLNEPSAASIEFGHRQRESAEEKAANVLVYDLGGGTFDVSLVEISQRTHTVVATEGIPTLGGDDFDGVLGELALEAAGVGGPQRDALSQAELFRLHEECRVKKEALHPNTRKIVVDLESVREGLGQVAVGSADYYDRCRPLIDETIHAMLDLLNVQGYDDDGLSTDAGRRRLEAVYVTGGGSELPQVSRMLKEKFGRRVRRSAHSRAATAIGLAIQADASAGYVLREQFNRYFGVWREAEAGQRIVFDPLFPKGTSLPGPSEPPLTERRLYRPVHNIGHFRFLECGQQAENGAPRGDITIWDEVQFPFDPRLQSEPSLSGVPITHSSPVEQQEIEEQYSCDASGTVVVRITNQSAGYSREFKLGRWASKDAPITPGKKRRKTASPKPAGARA